jgi:hypothetical protein
MECKIAEMAREDREQKAAVLGHPGRMISGSKSGYRNRFPKNRPGFNANVCVESGKIWHGDLDLTLDGERLQQLANELDEKVYVLHEMDARFENEESPLLDRAIETYEPIRTSDSEG